MLSCMSSPLMSCGRIARAATKWTTAKVGNNENLGSSSSGELRFSCLMCACVPMHGKRWNPELPSMPIFEGFWNLPIAYGIRLIWGSTALHLMWHAELWGNCLAFMFAECFLKVAGSKGLRSYDDPDLEGGRWRDRAKRWVAFQGSVGDPQWSKDLDLWADSGFTISALILSTSFTFVWFLTLQILFHSCCYASSLVKRRTVRENRLCRQGYPTDRIQAWMCRQPQRF